MKKTLLSLAVASLLLTGCGQTEMKVADPTKATAAAAESPAAQSDPPSPEPEPSPSPEPSPEPKITNMPIGQKITVTTSESTFEVAALSTATSKVAANQYADPPKNGTFVGALVQYTCLTGSCDYNPYDFVLRGPDGSEFDTAFVYDDPKFTPDLKSGSLTTGVKAKGYVVYDLAPGTYSLEYRANIFGDQAASWTVPVK